MGPIPEILEKFQPFIKTSRIHPSYPYFNYQICMEFENGYGCSIVTGEFARGNIEVMPLKIFKGIGAKMCGIEFNLDHNSSTLSFKDDMKLNEWLEVLYNHKN